MSELARRMGVSKARIGQIEQGSTESTITLDTLEPRPMRSGVGSSTSWFPANRSTISSGLRPAKARAEIGAVDHTMALEDQRPMRLHRARIEEAARHHVDKRGLWS